MTKSYQIIKKLSSIISWNLMASVIKKWNSLSNNTFCCKSALEDKQLTGVWRIEICFEQPKFLWKKKKLPVTVFLEKTDVPPP